MREAVLVVLVLISLMAIVLVTQAPILSTELMTNEERQALEALKVAGAQVRELDWWEVRDLMAEIAAKGYQLKMASREVKRPLRFPVKGPLEAAFSLLLKDYVNHVEISLNSQELLLAVDTGSPFTALTPRSAIKHKLPISLEFRPKREIKHYSVPAFLGEGRIIIGQIEVTSVPIIITQSNVRAKLLNIPIWHHTGTLGFDLLSQFSSVIIDYPNGALILRHQDLEYEPTVGAIKVPVRIFKFRPLVDVYLNGKGPFPFLFDTGASAKNLLVAPQIAVELGFVGRVSKLRLEMVKIGELRRERAEAEVILLPPEQEFLGIIPRGLFSSYKVTIDFKKKIIFFEQS